MSFFRIIIFSSFLVMSFWVSPIHAQKNIQELRISLFRSKVTEGPVSSDRFFNTTNISFEYQHPLKNYLNGLINIGTLQLIETEGKSRRTPKELERFSTSIISVDAGFVMIPLVHDKLQFRFATGGALRHRNEVKPILVIETQNSGNFVQNEYQSRWDLGGFFHLETNYSFNSRWFLALRSQFHTYDKSPAVFGVGISIGKKF